MRIVRYFFVGGVAASIDIGLFYIFAKQIGWNYFLVGAGSFSLATLANYILSVRHVFQSGVRFARHHEVMLVYLVSLVGLAVNQTVLYVGVEKLLIDLMYAKLLATAMVFFWNYGARAKFIFRRSA